MPKSKKLSSEEKAEKRRKIRLKLHRLLRGSLRNSCAPLTRAAEILKSDLDEAEVAPEDRIMALMGMVPKKRTQGKPRPSKGPEMPRTNVAPVTRLTPVQDAALDLRDAINLINRPEIRSKEHLLGVQGRRDLELIRHYLESAQRKLPSQS